MASDGGPSLSHPFQDPPAARDPRDPRAIRAIREAEAKAEALVRADIARRRATAWWYHAGLGLVWALMVFSMTLPLLGWQVTTVVVAMACLGFLVSAWEGATGVEIFRKYRAMTRKRVLTLLGILAVPMVGVLVVGKPVVTAVTAVVIFVATPVISWRTDHGGRYLRRHSRRNR